MHMCFNFCLLSFRKTIIKSRNTCVLFLLLFLFCCHWAILSALAWVQTIYKLWPSLGLPFLIVFPVGPGVWI